MEEYFWDKILVCGDFKLIMIFGTEWKMKLLIYFHLAHLKQNKKWNFIKFWTKVENETIIAEIFLSIKLSQFGSNFNWKWLMNNIN